MEVPKRTPAERACDVAAVAVAAFGFNGIGMAVGYVLVMVVASSLIFHWDWIFE
jgi:hypothetical protein